MSPIYLLAITLLPFLISVTIGAIQSKKPHLLPDNPNHRSSHSHTVSRGGGIAFLLPVLILMVYLIFFENYRTEEIIGLAAGLTAFSILGLFDDITDLSSGFRLIAQFVLATALIFYGTSETIVLFDYLLIEGWILRIFQIIWIVSIINFYNFMDGIDGIAALQGLFFSLIAAVFLHADINYLFNSDITPAEENPIFIFTALRDGFIVLFFGLIGFLVWNRPVARLFMGDSGSYFLGFLFSYSALLLVPAAGSHPEKILSVNMIQTGHQSHFSLYLILLLPFIADPAVTLIKKIILKKPIFHAHREHYYQKLHIFGWSVLSVDLLYMIFNTALIVPAVFYFFSKNNELHAAMGSAFIIIFFAVIAYLSHKINKKQS